MKLSSPYWKLWVGEGAMGLPALRPMQASRWFALQKIRHRETGCKPVHENHAVMTEVDTTWLENGRACPPVCLATPGFPGSPTICVREDVFLDKILHSSASSWWVSCNPTAWIACHPPAPVPSTPCKTAVRHKHVGKDGWASPGWSRAGRCPIQGKHSMLDAESACSRLITWSQGRSDPTWKLFSPEKPLLWCFLRVAIIPSSVFSSYPQKPAVFPSVTRSSLLTSL